MEAGYDGKIALIYVGVWYLFQTKWCSGCKGAETDEEKKRGICCWKGTLFYQPEFGLRGTIT